LHGGDPYGLLSADLHGPPCDKTHETARIFPPTVAGVNGGVDAVERVDVGFATFSVEFMLRSE
jgi:hypothetical protein